MTASIKGIAIGSLVRDAAELLASGEVPGEEVDRRLTAGDRELLASPVQDSGWYDLASYRRLLEFLRDFSGKGDPEYVRRRGAAVAERFLALGEHREVDHIRQVGHAEDAETAVSSLKLVASLWNSFFNFGRWDVFAESTGRYGVVAKHSHEMPEVGWQAVHGFMQRIAQEAAQPGSSIAVARKQSPEGEVLFVFGLDAS